MRNAAIRKSFVDHKFLNQSTSVHDGSGQQIVANWLAYAKALEAKNFDDAALYLENCLRQQRQRIEGVPHP
jgi:hypothetical protein